MADVPVVNTPEAAAPPSGSEAFPQTRLIVRSLPKHVDDKRLREHFSSCPIKGSVTDARVARTKEGKSRLFGFVGFATEADAVQALKFFNRTFFDTSRIQVDVARPKGDSAIPRPWSRHTSGSSQSHVQGGGAVGRGVAPSNPEAKRGVKRPRATAVEADAAPAADAPAKKSTSGASTEQEKEEFFAVMKRRSEAKFWGNDDVAPTNDVGGAAAEADSADSTSGESSDGTGSAAKDANAAGAQPSKSGGVSDMDWLRSKSSLAEKDGKQAGKERTAAANASGAAKGGARAGASSLAPPAKQEEEEDEEDTGRLFVRNLPFDTSEEDLREQFSPFGPVSEVHVPLDEMGRGKGFAFVQFLLPENAAKALAALDARPFKGRLMHVIKGRAAPKSASSSAAAGPGSATYKSRKEAERRVAAGDSSGWNSAFVRSDTVVEALAHKLGVTKGEVLDREQGDMAVRLALAETQLVRENREYFEREGVDLSALESAAAASERDGEGPERSDTILLVKNLPYSTEVGDLTELFGAQGSVSRVVLPPSHSVALVEFSQAADARRAFRRLAYKRFQHVPLYLEWAPVKVFSKKPAAAGGAKQKESGGAAAETNGSSGGAGKPAAATAEGAAASTVAGAKTAVVAALLRVDDDAIAAAGADAGEANTLYIKNLSFSTTEEALRQQFSSVPGLRAVAIPRKRAAGGSNSGSSVVGLSMGFGFAEFASAASVEQALQTLQGCMLDGHALQLSRSTKRLTKKAQQQPAAAGDDAIAAIKSTKLVVRNVAFQATAKELRDLFSAHGRVKRVRLPKKFDGGHRGFAFVEYALPREASDAFQALASTHLYGRHLVLEWAAAEEEAEGGGDGSNKMGELRAKAAKEARKAKAGGGQQASWGGGITGVAEGGKRGTRRVFESDDEGND